MNGFTVSFGEGSGCSLLVGALECFYRVLRVLSGVHVLLNHLRKLSQRVTPMVGLQLLLIYIS